MLTNYPPEKLKNLRIRSLLTVKDVSTLVGISQPTIHYAENGHKRLLKRNLDKLLTLYATRIKRLEGMERIWDGDIGQVREIGLAKGNGPARGPYKAKSTSGNAGRGV